MLTGEQLFKHMRFVRGVTLKALESTSENLANEIPFGFKNNIRWNLGHIYIIHELLAYHFSEGIPQIPNNYATLFQRATAPKDWKETPPSLQEISRYLTEQVERFERDFKDRLQENTPTAFYPTKEVSYSTVGELLNFAVWHEGNHIGTIKAIKRASGVTNLWELPED